MESVQLPETEQIVLSSCLKVLDVVQTDMVALEADLFERAKENPNVKLLMGIPGINVLSALTILAEIGVITRFSSPKKLASYAGLVPSVHQSGKTRYTGHITKEGRSTLRWILVQCAQRGIQSKSNLRSFYQRLKEKKGHKIAIFATARKLLHVIWAVLTRQEEYKDIRRDLLEKKLKTMHRRAEKYPVSVDELVEMMDYIEDLDVDIQYFLKGVG